MAQKVLTVLTDDIDGRELGDGDGETVLFALDGQSFEIDLSHANAEKMRKALAKYVEAGRRSSNNRPVRRRQVGPKASEVRAWAQSHGIDVPDRGRIPQSVMDAYNAS